MAPVSPLNESELELDAAYSISDGEEMTVAIVNAFHRTEIDIYEQQTELVDWIDPDIIETINWTDNPPILLSTLIWDRQVVITKREIRIYMPPLYRSSTNASSIIQ